MTNEPTQKPPLGESKIDRMAQIASTASGLIPFAGTVIQLAIEQVIPNIRMERVETYLRYLEEKITASELDKSLRTPEGLDLFEEGIVQSARALTDHRKRYIAELVANGLTSESLDQQQSRHFLRILNFIDDAQIVILSSYQPKYLPLNSPESAEFRNKHRDVLGPFSREIGPNNRDGNKAYHKDALENHLQSLGLLTAQGQSQTPGRTIYRITTQGLSFLSYLGIVE